MHGENSLELIFVLLGLMTVLAALARRTQIPYPIFLLLGGLAISFIPKLPTVELDPEMVFLLFLPPILTSSAYNTPIRDFKRNLRPILLLSLGLVIFTVLGIGVLMHFLIPQMPWAVAFVLGAILAPPDAIAATSIAERLGLPKRIVTILEGESLVNDASALIIYRAAIAAVAVVGGHFSLLELARDFVWVSLGGIAVGLALGFVINRMVTWLSDTPVEILLTLIGSFAAYVIAEQFHLSGVLASVVLGVYLGRQSPKAMSAQSRVESKVVWETLVFLINGTVFLLIGLQLPSVLSSLKADNMQNLLGYAVAVSLTVVVLRFVWVFPASYLPRILSRSLRERDPPPSWKYLTVISWTGMRGIVSLAAALSLPLEFPYRDLVIFLTFAVILVTLVGQGLSLPWLIGKLDLPKDTSHHREESWARLTAARAGLSKLDALEGEDWAKAGQVSALRSRYTNLQERYSARFWGQVHEHHEENSEAFTRLRFTLIEAELESLVEMRDNGTINDETMRNIQHELDLEWLRLESAGNRE